MAAVKERARLFFSLRLKIILEQELRIQQKGDLNN
jgi:hypothetical protein